MIFPIARKGSHNNLSKRLNGHLSIRFNREDNGYFLVFQKNSTDLRSWIQPEQWERAGKWPVSPYLWGSPSEQKHTVHPIIGRRQRQVRTARQRRHLHQPEQLLPFSLLGPPPHPPRLGRGRPLYWALHPGRGSNEHSSALLSLQPFSTRQSAWSSQFKPNSVTPYLKPSRGCRKFSLLSCPPPSRWLQPTFPAFSQSILPMEADHTDHFPCLTPSSGLLLLPAPLPAKLLPSSYTGTFLSPPASEDTGGRQMEPPDSRVSAVTTAGCRCGPFPNFSYKGGHWKLLKLNLGWELSAWINLIRKKRMMCPFLYLKIREQIHLIPGRSDHVCGIKRFQTWGMPTAL